MRGGGWGGWGLAGRGLHNVRCSCRAERRTHPSHPHPHTHTHPPAYTHPPGHSRADNPELHQIQGATLAGRYCAVHQGDGGWGGATGQAHGATGAHRGVLASSYSQRRASGRCSCGHLRATAHASLPRPPTARAAPQGISKQALQEDDVERIINVRRGGLGGSQFAIGAYQLSPHAALHGQKSERD